MMKNTATPAWLNYSNLKWLFIINIVTTILHYVDNVLFFAHYPEPDWLNPQLVDLFWFVMTPVALLSLWQYKRQHFYLGFALLVSYVLMSLLVLGHYRYAPFHEINFKIHLFIWLEAIAAIVLLVYGTAYTYHHRHRHHLDSGIQH